jgi:hypothetical protein
MARNPSKTGRQRRRRAKATVDFATGEVHDRSIDAAGDEDTGVRALAQAQGTAERDAAPDARSPAELSNEDRAQLGADGPPLRRRSRIPGGQSGLRWVRTRKIPSPQAPPTLRHSNHASRFVVPAKAGTHADAGETVEHRAQRHSSKHAGRPAHIRRWRDGSRLSRGRQALTEILWSGVPYSTARTRPPSTVTFCAVM